MKIRLVSKWTGRFSLRRKLIVGVTGVHAIMIISFVSDLVTRQETFLQERARERMLHQADMLAASAVPQLVTNDLAGLQDVLQSLSGDATIRSAYITDNRGLILGHSDRKQIGMFYRDNETQAILKGLAEAKIFHEGGRLVNAAAPVLIDRHVFGWAWVAGDRSEDVTQLSKLRRIGVLYTLFAVGTGGIIAVVMATGITRQLRLLLAGTRRLGEDILDQPVKITSDDEVGALARAFNHAMSKLAQQRADLNRAHEQLEAEILEHRRAEEQLKEANRSMTIANESLQQFAYAASHDLQEPLRAVAGYADLLKRRYEGSLDGDGKEFLGFIHEGAARMRKLISALLDYARAAAKDGEPARVVDTNRAFQTAIDNLQTAIESSQAGITADELPLVKAHEVAVAQLFQNLIGNAIKYAGARTPEIRISAESDGGQWRFAVRDNGIGIPTEARKRIFGIFKRAHGPDYPGTGVGLAICSKLVERYGGRIWVDSEVGAGTTFWFTLPAA
jgi:signal transduction histidine kinase